MELHSRKKEKSLIHTLSLAIFLILLVSNLVIITIFYLRIASYSRDNYIQSNTKIVQQNQYYSDFIATSVINYCSQIISTSSLQKLISNWDDSAIFIEDTQKDLNNLMESIRRANPYVHSILYINPGKFSAAVPAYRFLRQDTEKIVSQDIIHNTISNPGQFYWIPPRIIPELSPGKELLTMITAVQDRVYEENHGYILINLETEVFSSSLELLSSEGEMVISIMNSDGILISHPDTDLQGQEYGEAELLINKIEETETLHNTVLTQAESDNDIPKIQSLEKEIFRYFFISSRLRKSTQLVTYSVSPVTGWYFFSETPIQRLLQEGVNLILVFIVLQLTIFISSTFFSIRYVKKLLSPLGIISTEIRSFQEGNYTARVKGDFPFEFTQLKKSFNAMASQLEDDFEQIHNQMRQIESASQKEREARKETGKVKEHLKHIIDAMPSLIFEIDQSLTISLCNATVENEIKLNSDDILNKPLIQIIPRLNPYKEVIKNAVSTQTIKTISKIPIMWSDVSKFWELTIYPITYPTVKKAVIRLDNMTERIYLEQMMIQSEKMLSMGSMAAGVAHEINNPLASILQNLQVVQRRLSNELPRNLIEAEKIGVSMDNIIRYMETRKIHDMIKSARESGLKAAQIVKNMLRFSRKSSHEFSLTDIRILMDETIELAGKDYDLKKKYDFRSIIIEKEYADALPKITCEVIEIEQVLLNILKNGAHAMSTESKGPPRFHIKIDHNNDFCIIRISDNGPGIPEEVRKKIFEPFFTSKDIGKGTGLGMSISSFIIHDHHAGSIIIEESHLGGACFTIHLPFSQPKKNGY